MKAKYVMTKQQFKESGYNKSDYKIINEEGKFTATLDFQIWSNSDLLSYFTLSDGRKIVAGTFRSDNFFGLPYIPFGSEITLVFKKVTTKNIYLKKVIYANEEPVTL